MKSGVRIVMCVCVQKLILHLFLSTVLIFIVLAAHVKFILISTETYLLEAVKNS